MYLELLLCYTIIVIGVKTLLLNFNKKKDFLLFLIKCRLLNSKTACPIAVTNKHKGGGPFLRNIETDTFDTTN